MRIKLIILCYFIGYWINLNAQNSHIINNTVIIVYPGVGIDNIVLLQSDTTEIFKYRNLKYNVSSGLDGCTDDNYYEYFTNYKNDSIGLTLRFATPCISNPNSIQQKLTGIYLNETANACINNTSICIGRSSYADVVALYGKPTQFWQEKTYLRYRKLKLSMHFDTNGILSSMRLNSDL